MKTDIQIKLNIFIGILLIVVPLLGIPYSFKTFIIVALGSALVYFAVILRQKEKFKKSRKNHTKKVSVFEESKPDRYSRPVVNPEIVNHSDSEIVEVISQDNYEDQV